MLLSLLLGLLLFSILLLCIGVIPSVGGVGSSVGEGVVGDSEQLRSDSFVIAIHCDSLFRHFNGLASMVQAIDGSIGKDLSIVSHGESMRQRKITYNVCIRAVQDR